MRFVNSVISLSMIGKIQEFLRDHIANNFDSCVQVFGDKHEGFLKLTDKQMGVFTFSYLYDPIADVYYVNELVSEQNWTCKGYRNDRRTH